MIVLVCNVTSLSDSGQSLQWVKDGNILTWKGYGGRISINTKRSRDSPAMSSMLRVRDVTVDDAGDYTCRSSDLTHMTTMRVSVATGTFCHKDDFLSVKGTPGEDARQSRKSYQNT